ncbi:MAG: hypothetical protein AB2L14_03225 [Candidatus Xenobiia bacterium LiM19]
MQPGALNLVRSTWCAQPGVLSLERSDWGAQPAWPQVNDMPCARFTLYE